VSHQGSGISELLISKVHKTLRKTNAYKIIWLYTISCYSRAKLRTIAFFVLPCLQKGVERQNDYAGLLKTRQIKKSHSQKKPCKMMLPGLLPRK